MKVSQLIKSITQRASKFAELNLVGAESSVIKEKVKNVDLPKQENVEVPEILVSSRDWAGSRISRHYRSKGIIPGVIHGTDDEGNSERHLISMEKKTVDKLLRKYGDAVENILCRSVLDNDKVFKVTPQCLHLDPVSDEPVSMNFVRFREGRKLKIPLQFFNAEGSPGMKRGGYINYIHRDIPCVITGDSVPRSIAVDLSGKHVGDRIRLEELSLPDHIEPRIRADSIVATIAGKRGIRGDDASEETA